MGFNPGCCESVASKTTVSKRAHKYQQEVIRDAWK